MPCIELQDRIWSSVITHHVTGEVNFGRTCFVSLLATFKRKKSAQVKFPRCWISASLLEALLLFYRPPPLLFFLALTQCANATLLCHYFIGALALLPSSLVSSWPAFGALPRQTPRDLCSHLLRSKQAPALDRSRCHSGSVCCLTLPKSPVEHLCVAAACH